MLNCKKSKFTKNLSQRRVNDCTWSCGVLKITDLDFKPYLLAASTDLLSSCACRLFTSANDAYDSSFKSIYAPWLNSCAFTRYLSFLKTQTLSDRCPACSLPQKAQVRARSSTCQHQACDGHPDEARPQRPHPRRKCKIPCTASWDRKLCVGFWECHQKDQDHRCCAYLPFHTAMILTQNCAVTGLQRV